MDASGEGVGAGSDGVPSRRLRVLVALSAPPHPEGRAVGKCAVATIRGLVAAGADVYAVAAGWPGTERFRPPEDLPVEVVPVPAETGGRGTRLRRFARPRAHLGLGPMGERVRELASRYDVLLVDEIDALWCGIGAPVPAGLHLYYLVRRDRPLDVRWTAALRRGAEFELGERLALSRYRHLVVSSDGVAAELRRRAGVRAEVHEVRLGLDPAFYAGDAAVAEPVAGLIGTATWPPTSGAVRALLRSWPSVRARAPEARLRLAGRGMVGLAVSAPALGIDVQDEVASASEFVSGLGVLAYPLPRGSGVKVKVLEAMASGVPVVTTAEGAEGVVPNDGVVVTAGGDDFVRATSELLGDVSARRERGSAGRAAFLRHHSPRAVAAALGPVLTRIAEDR